MGPGGAIQAGVEQPAAIRSAPGGRLFCRAGYAVFGVVEQSERRRGEDSFVATGAVGEVARFDVAEDRVVRRAEDRDRVGDGRVRSEPDTCAEKSQAFLFSRSAAAAAETGLVGRRVQVGAVADPEAAEEGSRGAAR